MPAGRLMAPRTRASMCSLLTMYADIVSPSKVATGHRQSRQYRLTGIGPIAWPGASPPTITNRQHLGTKHMHEHIANVILD